MKIKCFAIVLIAALFPVLSFAQGSAFTAGPFSASGFVYVCPVPSGGTPCPAPSTIYSTITLTTPICNPIQITAGNTVTFYAAGGQYTIQFPATGFSQVVGGGSSSSGAAPPGWTLQTTPCGSNTNCTQIKGDGKYVVDATSNSTTTVTC